MATNLQLGLPSVEPGSAPGGFQTVRADAEDFGAGIGRGLQSAGQGAQQAAQAGFRVNDYFDDVAADDAANQFQERIGQMLNGRPDQMVETPEGPKQDLGYLSTKGRQALDGRATVEKAIEALQNEISGGLKSEAQKKKFGDFAGKYKTATTAKISNHADMQGNVWYGEVNTATEKLALAQIANNPDSPEDVAAYSADLINARVKNAELKGAQPGDTVWMEAVASGKREALKAQTESVAVYEPAKALDILDQNREIAGTSYDELAGKFRSRAYEQKGRTVADEAMMQANVRPTAPIAGTATAERVNAAIIQQESGGNPNVPASVNGAVGIGQIMPETFKAYALAGESIDNPLDNAAVSRRITADYFQKYKGDPQRVAVAYFSGEGNVAPEGSPTPWKRDVADGNGKTVSAYVADVQNRLGAQTDSAPLTARIAQNKAAAVQTIMDRKDLKPEEREAALKSVDSMYRAQAIAAEQDAAAKTAMNAAAADGYTKSILDPKGPPAVLYEQIRLDPSLNYTTRTALLEAFEKHSSDEVSAKRRAYGDGFWDAYKRVTAPAGDPNRIQDVSELLRMAGPGGNLTLAGVTKLNDTIKEMAKPESAALAAMKTGALAYAKSQLSFEFEYGNYKLADPQGMDDYNVKFIPAFYGALEQGISAGKTPMQLLSKDSPDFIVDKLVSTYKRPEAALMRDKLLSGMKADPNKKGAKLPPDTSSLDGLKASVSNGSLSRDEAIKIAVEKGWARAVQTTPPVR